MSYVYTGPIGSSVNGFAAFISSAAAYFAPVTLQSVVVGPVFFNNISSLGGIEVFLQTYGSVTINVRQIKLLDKKIQETLKVYIDKNLVEITDLSPEGLKVFEMLKTRLGENDALSLAQAIDSGIHRVVIESEEARRLAVELGLTPIYRESFFLEAYKRGLLPSREILKLL